jgi:hypothetical protein
MSYLSKDALDFAAAAIPETMRPANIKSDFKLAAQIVKRIAPEITKQRRKDFKSRDKRFFFALAATELSNSGVKGKELLRLQKIISEYEIHHIVPLSLNGSNKTSNLALVSPDQHIKIHIFISKQGEIDIGQRKEIIIPRAKGLIWHSDLRL